MPEMFGVSIIAMKLTTQMNLRSTIGVNTSWMSPAGPMSFIFSKNISKADH